MENKKYKPTKKNGGLVPLMKDKRVMVVPIACGNCIECRKKKAQEWRIRLIEELKHQNKLGNRAIMTTLTFNTKSLKIGS